MIAILVLPNALKKGLLSTGSNKFIFHDNKVKRTRKVEKGLSQPTFPAISGAEPCTASASAIPPSPMLQLQET